TSVVDNVLGDLTAAANAAWAAQGHTGAIVLAPNQSFSFTFTSQTALNAGTVVNIVTVSGHDDENTPATGSGTASVTVLNVPPSTTVDKSAPTSVSAGQPITYTYTITNTSPASTDPVTITSILDDQLGELITSAVAANGGNPIVLAP